MPGMKEDTAVIMQKRARVSLEDLWRNLNLILKVGGSHQLWGGQLNSMKLSARLWSQTEQLDPHLSLVVLSRTSTHVFEALSDLFLW